MSSYPRASRNVCKYTVFLSPLISIGEENVIEEKKLQKNKEKILEEKKIRYLNPQKTSLLPGDGGGGGGRGLQNTYTPFILASAH